MVDPAYQCNEPVRIKDELCVLHSGNTKDVASFVSKVEEKKRRRDFNFRGTIFPTQVSFEYTEAADFSEAIFKEKASFVKAVFKTGVTFAHAKFRSEADFTLAVFQGDARFDATEFESQTTFSRAKFHLEASFYETKLHDTDFRETRFSQHANFTDATFHGVADFYFTYFGTSAEAEATSFVRTIFSKEAYFTQTGFWQGVDFDSAKFLADARFVETAFGVPAIQPPGGDEPSASFLGSRFGAKTYFRKNECTGPLDFTSAEFDGALLVVGPFYEAHQPDAGSSPPPATIPTLCFENVLLAEPTNVRFESLNLGATTFAGTNIRGSEFRDVDWPKRLLGKKLLADVPGVVPYSPVPRWKRRMASGWRSSSMFFAHSTTADEWNRYIPRERARRVCRDLKANLEDQRDYADAGDFYYAEMELRREQLGRIRGCLLWLYWLVCGYGEKPLRALVTFGCVWLALSVAFGHTWFIAGENVKWRTEQVHMKREFKPIWTEAAGHSIRSLTLQQNSGYLKPYSPWAHRLTLFANGVGPTQLGLFLLAMRRRFRR